ncbi:PEP-CTERM sorting domain-containing protein [Novosphingobium sp. SL115]|uniref:PEP-CTERM sorting domain-containing protein n=1 Tax=Novosphingobium sp. SL115 TaxID=2995150 RepID=UPI0022733E60|nr:PEP-CTERM sorting domain-containing protein [Novosphingobium sp. SL115]MCY1671202.1 PEP-CTERM sorting domain-containing protein [Novosphingobium sp. SL115]
MVRPLISIVIALCAAAPAYAQSSGVSVPEPTTTALLGLGIVGLIVGRQVAKRKD